MGISPSAGVPRLLVLQQLILDVLRRSELIQLDPHIGGRAERQDGNVRLIFTDIEIIDYINGEIDDLVPVLLPVVFNRATSVQHQGKVNGPGTVYRVKMRMREHVVLLT